jgi:hypothetical protein
MKAELILMGKRLDMGPQSHRKTLVVVIYASLALIMTGLWFIDRWRASGVYLIFLTIAINRLLLGGYNFGGLVKPFNGKAPSNSIQPSPFLALGLRLYRPPPEESDYRNDERELQQRDHAHYLAYQALAVALVVIWLVADFNRLKTNLFKAIPSLAWIPNSSTSLIYGLTLGAIVLSQTLPQSILLWKEPDMPEPDPLEPDLLEPDLLEPDLLEPDRLKPARPS